MNLNELLLFFVPGFPLVLSIPLLHKVIPRTEYLAILPAVVFLILPENIFVETPWLLFGSGLGSSDETQLMLMASIVLWLIAAFALNTDNKKTVDRNILDSSHTYFLLTLSGYMGVILSNGLIGFFVFSTIMSYGFYGLMVEGGNSAARKAGRVYIFFIIVADLLLFEAALLAATVTDDMAFDSVTTEVASSSIAEPYLLMVLIGFFLKVGFWPAHYWLVQTFHSTRTSVKVLLASVPVAIALLGALRWLPLGEMLLPTLGLILQGIGSAAIVYWLITGLLRRQCRHPAAYFISIVTGLFAIALGTGFSHPALWYEYSDGMFIFIFLFSITAALLVIVHDMLFPTMQALTLDEPISSMERWSIIILDWWRRIGDVVLPRWRNRVLTRVFSLWDASYWKKVLRTGELVILDWSIALTFLLISGIVVVLLVINW